MSRMQELAAAKTAGNVVAVSPPPQGSAFASGPSGQSQARVPQSAPDMRTRPQLN